MKTNSKIGSLSDCDNESCAISLTQQYSNRSLSQGRRLTGWCFAFLALLACPCHLPFWIMLFSGTALGLHGLEAIAEFGKMRTLRLI